MNKVIAYTVVSDDVAYYLAERVKRSFLEFHPDAEFRIVTLFDEADLFGFEEAPKIGSRWANLSTKLVGKFLEDHDIVIKLDSDVVITGRLDEFLDLDYDIAGSLNCKDVGGIDYKRFPSYCNLGVVAVKSKEFAAEWAKLSYDAEFLKKEQFHYMEQDVMNYLAHGGGYKFIVVDPNTPGASYYNETGREHWKNIRIKHKGLFIGDRQLKAMHWAGGGEIGDKYNWPDLPSDVKRFSNKLTKTEDFV